MKARYVVIPLITFVLGLFLGAYFLMPLHVSRLKAQADQQQRQQQNARKQLGEAQLLGMAFMEYALDHNEQLPPLKDWQNKVKPYLHPNALGALARYRYAPNMAGKRLAEIKLPAETIILQPLSNLPEGPVINVYADGRAAAEPEGRRQMG